MPRGRPNMMKNPPHPTLTERGGRDSVLCEPSEPTNRSTRLLTAARDWICSDGRVPRRLGSAAVGYTYVEIHVIPLNRPNVLQQCLHAVTGLLFIAATWGGGNARADIFVGCGHATNGQVCQGCTEVTGTCTCSNGKCTTDEEKCTKYATTFTSGGTGPKNVYRDDVAHCKYRRRCNNSMGEDQGPCSTLLLGLPYPCNFSDDLVYFGAWRSKYYETGSCTP